MSGSTSRPDLFRTFIVPPDIARPASAIEYDLREAREKSQYQKQLLQKMEAYAIRRSSKKRDTGDEERRKRDE